MGFEMGQGTRSRVLRIVALSGSLRKASSNTALLRASARLAPVGVSVDLYEDLAALPAFSPDLESDLYDDGGFRVRQRPLDDSLRAVRDLNERVKAADGVLIACPEYARGVPGAFKNALDWLVGGDGFVNKPFAQFNASPRAHHAQAALRLTLETMSGIPVEPACLALPLLNRDLDANAIVADEQLAGPIRRALAALVDAVRPEE